MTNEEFIKQHRHDDVRTLALRRAEEGVDVKWCLQQIEGWQKACEKLPRWSQVDGLWYPPALSMEQCSSELTARYKADIVSRLLPECSERGCFADLTGGYGIDFSYMASLFATSVYVERNAELCRIAEHNFALLICLVQALFVLIPPSFCVNASLRATSSILTLRVGTMWAGKPLP